jgi:hypothetical protein
MNYDDWKLATPEQNLRHYCIVVTFTANKNDEEYIRRNINMTFPRPNINITFLEHDAIEVSVEFTDEYDEGNIEHLVRDAMYKWAMEIGLSEGDIDVDFD